MYLIPYTASFRRFQVAALTFGMIASVGTTKGMPLRLLPCLDGVPLFLKMPAQLRMKQQDIRKLELHPKLLTSLTGKAHHWSIDAWGENPQ